MNPKRREVLKGIGYAAGLTTGAKAAQEAGNEIIDILNGECDSQASTVTLGPGDALHYRQNGQEYYLEHVDQGMQVEARIGPVDQDKKTVEVDYSDQTEVEGAQLTRETRSLPDIHVNLGDIITGGDVIEPRGPYGLAPSNIQASYDNPICIIERGEASEMRNHL